MKKVVFLLIVFACIQTAIAALPPRFQNMNDLDVMVEYIRVHPTIASTLKSIDLQEYTVYFGDGCKAVFGRKSVMRRQGWVGPAPPLEFKSSNCPVD